MHILCVLLLVWDSELATHPYSSDMDTHDLAANSTASLHCFLQHPTYQFVFVGERASDRFYWSSPFAAKQSPKKLESMLISRSAVAEKIPKEMLEI